MSKCRIEECERGAKINFCDIHWFALPLPFRLNYLRKTDYGRKLITDELLQEANNLLACAKCRNTGWAIGEPRWVACDCSFANNVSVTNEKGELK